MRARCPLPFIKARLVKPRIFGHFRSLLANLLEKQRLQNKGSLIVLLGSPLPTAAPTPGPTERMPLTLQRARAASAVLVTLRGTYYSNRRPCCPVAC